MSSIRCDVDLLNSTNQVITLGSLYSKDVPNGIFLSVHPSSFNPQAIFFNSHKYLVQDKPPIPPIENEYANTFLICCIAGDELPIFLYSEPPSLLKKHWQKWLPYFPEAKFCFNLSSLESRDFKFSTKFPIESLPKDIHAVDPDAHYEMLSKSSIPKMGANCPRYMGINSYTTPCMIKVPHGSAGRGVFLAKSKIDAENILKKIKNEYHCTKPIISEVIPELLGNYCAQFYLRKSGDMIWIGCGNQDISEEFRWKGTHVNWNEQDNLKNKLYDTVMPVKEFLHKNGYFGVVGVDILSNKDGNFVVDVNPRLNASTYLLLIAPHMARNGYPFSAWLTIKQVKYSESEVINKFNIINSKGKEMVITLTIYAQNEVSSAKILIFAKDADSLDKLYQKMVDHQSW